MTENGKLNEMMQHLDSAKQSNAESVSKSITCHVYVLKLEGGNWYVGMTRKDDPHDRIKKHLNGRGSEWTKIHEPLEVAELRTDVKPEKERTLTLKYMRIHGWQNVRGYAWSMVDLDSKPSCL